MVRKRSCPAVSHYLHVSRPSCIPAHISITHDLKLHRLAIEFDRSDLLSQMSVVRVCHRGECQESVGSLTKSTPIVLVEISFTTVIFERLTHDM